MGARLCGLHAMDSCRMEKGFRHFGHDISSEEGVSNIGFIRIDCQPLKQALNQHCITWQNKFTQLLNSNAASELANSSTAPAHGHTTRQQSFL